MHYYYFKQIEGHFNFKCNQLSAKILVPVCFIYLTKRTNILISRKCYLFLDYFLQCALSIYTYSGLQISFSKFLKSRSSTYETITVKPKETFLVLLMREFVCGVVCWSGDFFCFQIDTLEKATSCSSHCRVFFLVNRWNYAKPGQFQ